MEGSQGNCPKFGRLYASAVKRSRPKWGGKMPLHGLTEKRTDRRTSLSNGQFCPLALDDKTP